MNHIKSYKVFEGINTEMKEHILDICSPIVEEGFLVKVDINPTRILVEINYINNNQSNSFSHNKSFYFEEIKDELHHIIEYLKEEGFNNTLIEYNRKDSGLSRPIKTNTSNLDVLEGEDITRLSISFTTVNK